MGGERVDWGEGGIGSVWMASDAWYEWGCWESTAGSSWLVYMWSSWLIHIVRGLCDMTATVRSAGSSRIFYTGSSWLIHVLCGVRGSFVYCVQCVKWLQGWERSVGCSWFVYMWSDMNEGVERDWQVVQMHGICRTYSIEYIKCMVSVEYIL